MAKAPKVAPKSGSLRTRTSLGDILGVMAWSIVRASLANLHSYATEILSIDVAQSRSLVALEKSGSRFMIRIRPFQLLILCGVLFVGAVISSTVLVLSNLHQRALTESSRELNNVVLVLAEQTDRAIRATELLEDSLIERIQALGVSSPETYESIMSGHDIHLFLKEKA